MIEHPYEEVTLRWKLPGDALEYNSIQAKGSISKISSSIYYFDIVGEVQRGWPGSTASMDTDFNELTTLFDGRLKIVLCDLFNKTYNLTYIEDEYLSYFSINEVKINYFNTGIPMGVYSAYKDIKFKIVSNDLQKIYLGEKFNFSNDP